MISNGRDILIFRIENNMVHYFKMCTLHIPLHLNHDSQVVRYHCMQVLSFDTTCILKKLSLKKCTIINAKQKIQNGIPNFKFNWTGKNALNITFHK